MDCRVDELDKNHKVLVSRSEDTEDDMQVVKTDVDVLRIEMSFFNKDVKDVEMSVDNVHFCLEKVEDRVDSFVSLLCSQT
jgi:predicted nuclease with TOPRIM domain